MGVGASKIYFASPGLNCIAKISLDGSNFQRILMNTGDVRDIVIDKIKNILYFIQNTNNVIKKLALNGSSTPETIVSSGINFPWGIAHDFVDDKVYWTDNDDHKICRVDSDGSNFETILSSGIVNPRGIAIDYYNRKLYFTDANSTNDGRIYRCNMNGSNLELLLGTQDEREAPSPLETPGGIDLDLEKHEMYWVDGDTQKVQKAGMDIPEGSTAFNRTDISTLFTSTTGHPAMIVLDLINVTKKMYWTDIFESIIFNANLDGTYASKIFVGSGFARGLDLYIVPE